ncbi:hypothetical protein [Caulobacter phage KSC]|uniref:Uncharacterized protein n=1 Tax=Caulobacter phage KSC TaxID=3020398 RepID=A0AAE9X674_9CAUD|nr:hypothetical protein [Caulobacter phage KSC]
MSKVNVKTLVRDRVQALRIRAQQGTVSVEGVVKELFEIEHLLARTPKTRHAARRTLRTIDAALIREIKDEGKARPDTTVVILAEDLGTSIATVNKALRGEYDYLLRN